VSLFGCCFTIYVMVIVMHVSAFGGCSFATRIIAAVHGLFAIAGRITFIFMN